MDQNTKMLAEQMSTGFRIMSEKMTEGFNLIAKLIVEKNEKNKTSSYKKTGTKNIEK